MRTSCVFAPRLFPVVETSLVTAITSLTGVEGVSDLLDGYRSVMVLNFLIYYL